EARLVARARESAAVDARPYRLFLRTKLPCVDGSIGTTKPSRCERRRLKDDVMLDVVLVEDERRRATRLAIRSNPETHHMREFELDDVIAAHPNGALERGIELGLVVEGRLVASLREHRRELQGTFLQDAARAPVVRNGDDLST